MNKSLERCEALERKAKQKVAEIEARDVADHDHRLVQLAKEQQGMAQAMKKGLGGTYAQPGSGEGVKACRPHPSPSSSSSSSSSLKARPSRGLPREEFSMSEVDYTLMLQETSVYRPDLLKFMGRVLKEVAPGARGPCPVVVKDMVWIAVLISSVWEEKVVLDKIATVPRKPLTSLHLVDMALRYNPRGGAQMFLQMLYVLCQFMQNVQEFLASATAASCRTMREKEPEEKVKAATVKQPETSSGP